MKGSNVSYSSFGELKKAHTCRCSRSIERANGIGAGAELVMSLYLRRVISSMFEGRRAGESPCTATVDASRRAAGAWPESQCFRRYVAKVVGIAVAISGQVHDSLRNDLLDDARLA